MSSLQPTRISQNSNVMEEQHTISVFLPSVELVVHGQRHAFLEPLLGVCGPANDVSFELIGIRQPSNSKSNLFSSLPAAEAPCRSPR